MRDTDATIFVRGADIGLTNSLILVLKMWHKIKSDGDAHCTGQQYEHLWRAMLGDPALQGSGPIAPLGWTNLWLFRVHSLMVHFIAENLRLYYLSLDLSWLGLTDSCLCLCQDERPRSYRLCS